LDLSAETAWERIVRAGELPPFLRAESPGASREKHRDLHRRRGVIYRKSAALTVAAEGKSPGDIAGEIREMLLIKTNNDE
jgi:shikimate kinase